MAIDLTADLDFALKDATQAASPNVVYGAQSCYGILHTVQVEEPAADGMHRVGSNDVLVIRNGALTGLVPDATITVNSTSYVIHDIGTKLSDGTRHLTLSEAP